MPEQSTTSNNQVANEDLARQFGPYELRQDSGAMLRLALGSSCTIATLLCIPDSVALIPNSANASVFFLRLIGLWFSAFILWSVSFLGLLHVMKFLSAGITLDGEGFKLWRFGKPVHWQDIRAVGIEPQPFFSKAFFIRPTVMRLTVYEEKKSWKGGVKLVPRSVPSFLFAPEDFTSLFAHICKQSFGFIPHSTEVLIGASDERSKLRRQYEKGHTQRILLSLIIASGLILFLGRKAILNYSFNAGNKAFNQEDYATAREHYKLASMVEQTFAPAWDRLARSEYRMGRIEEARQHWLMALRYKPDFVEAKIALSTIHATKREFKEARALLQKALRLASRNMAALINLAELDYRQGFYDKTIETAEIVLKQDPKNERARCLVIRSQLKMNDVETAAARMKVALEENPKILRNPFCRMVWAELISAQGDHARALRIFESLKPVAANSTDLLTDIALLKIQQKQFSAVPQLLDQVQELNSRDPWPYILKAELVSRGQYTGADKNKDFLAEALGPQRQQDVQSLMRCAALYRARGNNQEAMQLELEAQTMRDEL